MRGIAGRAGWVAGVLMAASTAGAFQDDDRQVWVEFVMQGGIDKDWKVTGRTESRFGDDARNHYYSEYEGGVVRALGSWLEAGVSLNMVYKDGAAGLDEERDMRLNVTPKFSIGGFDFSDRNRFEFASLNAQDDQWRYRNQLQAALPWKWTRYAIRPYVSEEIFYNFDDSNLYRNRLAAGLRATVGKATPSLYAMWQADDKDPHWQDTYVAGLGLTLRF